MNVKTLRQILNTLPSRMDDLDVRVVADHAQCAMVLEEVTAGVIVSGSYMADVEDYLEITKEGRKIHESTEEVLLLVSG